MVNDRNAAIGCAMMRHRIDSTYLRYFVCNYGYSNVFGEQVYESGQVASKCKKKHPFYEGLCSTEIADTDFEKNLQIDQFHSTTPGIITLNPIIDSSKSDSNTIRHDDDEEDTNIFWRSIEESSEIPGAFSPNSALSLSQSQKIVFFILFTAYISNIFFL